MNRNMGGVGEAIAKLELVPALEEAVLVGGLDRTRISVGLKIKGEKPDMSAREQIMITDNTKTATWEVSSLRGLFRGDNVPPAMPGEPPPAYMPLFYFIESHVLTFCNSFGDKTDGEFENVYSNLRRRPDGKSQDALHFFLWQVAAGLLGRKELSAAEYDAIFAKLTKSARTFRQGVVSRNYVSILRRMR